MDNHLLRLDWTPRAAADAPPPLASGAVHVWWLTAGDRAGADALIAAYAGLAADAFAQRRVADAHGKPRLDGDSLQYNLAHSGERLLLALAHDTALGVDVEHARRIRRREALLARCFTPKEQAHIRAAADTHAALLGAWTAKEALVKAIGRGIAYGLTNIELALDGDVPALARLDGPAAPASDWSLAAFVPETGYRAALAVRGALGPVSAFRAA